MIARMVVVAAALLLGLGACSKAEPEKSTTGASHMSTSPMGTTTAGQMMPGMQGGMPMDGGYMHDGGMGMSNGMPGHM